MSTSEVPLWTSGEALDLVRDAIGPLVDGKRLIAAKVYYVYSTDGHTLDVAAMSLAPNEQAQDALAALIREEEELAALPHAEHRCSFIRNQPTRH
jgi:hypothetical protein